MICKDYPYLKKRIDDWNVECYFNGIVDKSNACYWIKELSE